MRQEVFWWLVTIGGVGLVTAAITAGYVTAGVVVFATVGFLIVTAVGRKVAIDTDRSWFPGLLQAAFIVKILGILARYYAVTVIYRTGDAYTYHDAGLTLVHDWRNWEVPVVVGRSAGTRFTEVATGLLYVPGEPNFLGGFLIFGTISFIGVVFFYLAFRRSMPESLHKPYAVLLLFMPTLVFWPSSIGKDALMIGALGAAALGASIMYSGRYFRALPLLAGGLALSAAVRPHVAAMIAGGIALGFILAKRSSRESGWFGRLVVAGAALVALISVGSIAAESLGLGEDALTLEEFLTETERQTAQGGSAVTGSPVRSPLDLPEATLRVLFRPLPHEADDAPTLLSSLEGAALLFLTVLRLPTILGNLRNLRRYPYLLMAFGYSGAFIVAFSAIFNLGILARQRAQVLPLFLAVLVGLGWERLAPHRRRAEPEQVRAMVPA